ncbi:methyltransferase [Bacillus coahuilensis p1.1.43]|uniref:Methyltransferase n=1 Tax=Bacillus coahuilensis p1.1.43 TaxID=1150625 RepID=A0A147KBN3_9BACI|nr:class I SAM-dependent methyltransferase [Bacillus coahuilensis]KUP08843.1 methyltransferase [Bacillus coahuilensis p1.1.43]
MNEWIKDYEDVLEMLDSFFREPAPFWDRFYKDREKKIPFFVKEPDENLVGYFDNGLFAKGKVLELGCGPGRNALYFSHQGCQVDAVDLSGESLEWANERADEAGADIHFIKQNIFHLSIEEGTYDIVYDSGCFHHIAPHRRNSYIHLVEKALKPGGYFALTCFKEGGELGGATLTDWDVYRQGSLKGGLGYTEDKLRTLFHPFHEVEIREMNECKESGAFGVRGLLTAVFRKW